MKKSKETKLISVRVPENIGNKLQSISSQKHESINQIAKKAIIEWIEIVYTSRKLDMVLFPKAILSRILNSLKENTFKSVSEDIADIIVKYYQYLFDTHLQHIGIEEFISITRRFLSSSGLMWLDHVEFDVQKKEPLHFFKGIHDMDETWSRFFIIFMTYLVEKFFKFSIIDDTIAISSNAIYFECEIKQ